MNLKMKQIRVGLGLGQKEVAARLNMPVRRYGSYERGERTLSLDVAYRIADVFGCTLDELAGRDFPAENFSATSEERGLVDSYRRMDEEDKPGFMSTARALAYAGEAKKEGKGADVALAGDDVRERV